MLKSRAMENLKKTHQEQLDQLEKSNQRVGVFCSVMNINTINGKLNLIASLAIIILYV